MKSRHMKNAFKKTVGVIFCFFAVVASAQEDNAEARFVQFINGDGQWEGKLQTAIVSYENAKGVELDLVAAVHLGEVDYYTDLNAYFESRDAVLYELVAYENDRPSPNDQIRNVSTVSFVQRTLGDFLNVSFQLEQVDYSPRNFIHADLNPDELLEIMTAKNENFFSMFMTLAVAQMASEQTALQQGGPTSSFTMLSIVNALLAEDQTAAFKFLFAEELGRTDGVIVGPELESQITILGDRNQAALETLRETLKNPQISTISIFYGAAHMPGIERELLENFGFEKSQQRWIDAWIVP